MEGVSPPPTNAAWMELAMKWPAPLYRWMPWIAGKLSVPRWGGTRVLGLPSRGDRSPESVSKSAMKKANRTP